MKFHHNPDTDLLYIDLAERPSVDSREAAPGVVLDFDAQGRRVGIDIENTGQRLERSKQRQRQPPSLITENME